MRGYSDEEVDVFLDEVADEFERLFQENMEMQDRMQRLEEQIAGHVQIKDALEKTLISAQLQSDEMRANARKESELILRDAELKARHIVNDSYGETQRVQQALIQLKHLEEDFRFKFRSLLEGHLKLLNEAPITVPGRWGRRLWRPSRFRTPRRLCSLRRPVGGVCARSRRLRRPRRPPRRASSPRRCHRSTANLVDVCPSLKNRRRARHPLASEDDVPDRGDRVRRR